MTSLGSNPVSPTSIYKHLDVDVKWLIVALWFFYFCGSPTMLSKQTENIPSRQLKHLLGDSALLLTILTTTLYCIGTSHLNGLLSALSTDPYLIDRSFHQIIYNGGLILFNTISLPLLFVSLALMTLYVAIVIGLLEFNWTYRRKKRLVRLRSKFQKLNIPTNNTLRFSIFACTTLVTLILILIYFQSVGEQAGRKFINDIQTKNTKNIEKITVRIDSSDVELLRVTCGTTFCLGVDEKQMQVRVFEKNAVLYTKITSK